MGEEEDEGIGDAEVVGCVERGMGSWIWGGDGCARSREGNRECGWRWAV